MNTVELSNAWRNSVLRKTLVGSVATKSRVINLNHRDSVQTAIATLESNNILSAPVVNTDTNMCWGSVDLLDLLTYILWVPSTEMAEFPSLTKMKQRFAHPLSTVLTELGQKEFFPVLETVNLAQAVANYLQKQIHRLVVVNADNNVTGILSQADIIDFMYRRIDTEREFSLLANVTISQLFDLAHFRAVVKVSSSVTLLEAFRTLIGAKVSGLAVVDGITGKLVGNLSASDFRGFDAFNVGTSRTMTVGTFIGAQAPLYCKADTTFREYLRLTDQFGVHRLYLVDDNLVPAAVVSLTDVMNLVTNMLAL